MSGCAVGVTKGPEEGRGAEAGTTAVWRGETRSLVLRGLYTQTNLATTNAAASDIHYNPLQLYVRWKIRSV